MNYYDAVLDKVRVLISDNNQSVAHRMDHIQRVLSNSCDLAEYYPEADLELLKLSALLHDICQPFDRKEEHVKLSVNMAREILQEVGYPAERAEKVLRIISEHSTECISINRPTSIEAKILFDADKLDGLGASGIARVFALFGQQGKVPLEAVPWYLHKMKAASENIQTEQERLLAIERSKYVLDFIKRIKAENNYEDK